MVRCESCGTFVSYAGDEEPEVSSAELEGDDGRFTVELLVRKDCANCGSQLKEATLTIEGRVLEDAVLEHRRQVMLIEQYPALKEFMDQAGYEEHQQEDAAEVYVGEHDVQGHEGLELEYDDPEYDEKLSDKDRRGRPVTNPRYQVMLYGARINLRFVCECGTVVEEREEEAHVRSSEMDDV